MLNKEEKFVQKIIEVTKNSVLKWSVPSVSKHSDKIENAHNVIRLFESNPLSVLAPENLGFQNRTLVLYEIKKISFHIELEDYYESKAIVLMLLNNSIKEQTFDASTISKDILCKLMDTVSNSIFDTDAFISLFETNQQQ